VTIGLAPRRSSHVPVVLNVLARHRCPIHPLKCARCTSSITQRVRAAKVAQHAREGTASRRGGGGCAVPPLEIRVQAIQLSPYRAGLAGHYPTRLPMAPASPTCSCPFWLSPSGKSDDPEASLRTSPDYVRDSAPRPAAHTFTASGSPGIGDFPRTRSSALHSSMQRSSRAPRGRHHVISDESAAERQAPGPLRHGGGVPVLGRLWGLRRSGMSSVDWLPFAALPEPPTFTSTDSSRPLRWGFSITPTAPCGSRAETGEVRCTRFILDGREGVIHDRGAAMDTSHRCHARSHRAGSGDRGRLARRLKPPSLDRTMRSLSQAPRLGRRPRASRGLFRGSFFTMDWPPSIATPQGLTDVLIKPVASSAHAADAPRGAHASDAHALQRGTAPLPAWASHVHHDALCERT